MRHRSPTNSRPAENLSLRRQYMEKHRVCELHKYFPGHFPVVEAHDPHHLFGGRAGRWDLLTNIVSVSRQAHDWAELFKTDGRVLGIWIKMRKMEFGAAEFKQASGQFIAGWLMGAEVRHDWVQQCLDRLRLVFP